ncbi:hypothetical protein CPC16_006474 [Podila verticillata]|nr:hypothetical protein CPC16_006474 [Podila verticillata]
MKFNVFVVIAALATVMSVSGVPTGPNAAEASKRWDSNLQKKQSTLPIPSTPHSPNMKFNAAVILSVTVLFSVPAAPMAPDEDASAEGIKLLKVAEMLSYSR